MIVKCVPIYKLHPTFACLPVVINASSDLMHTLALGPPVPGNYTSSSACLDEPQVKRIDNQYSNGRLIGGLSPDYGLLSTCPVALALVAVNIAKQKH